MFSFASNRTGNYELYVVDSSGKNAAAMTNLHASYVGWQSWAPDGNQIAFVAAPTGQRDIYVIDAAGGRQPRLIVNHPNDDIMPAWSRDGQSIYFGSNRTGEFQVWKVDARGGTAIPVTTKGGYSGFESPDGTAFYFTQATASAGLWRVPAAGKEPELVFEPLHRSNRAVHLEGLYFVRQEAAGNSLLFRDWAGRFATLLTGQPDFLGLSVAPDGRSIVYARRDRENTDLMLVENFK
jgi:dipeptidyl aminopeptidase/acylaminoacyl peptidase